MSAVYGTRFDGLDGPVRGQTNVRFDVWFVVLSYCIADGPSRFLTKRQVASTKLQTQINDAHEIKKEDEDPF
jgi:hypothetical protein